MRETTFSPAEEALLTKKLAEFEARFRQGATVGGCVGHGKLLPDIGDSRLTRELARRARAAIRRIITGYVLGEDRNRKR